MTNEPLLFACPIQHAIGSDIHVVDVRQKVITWQHPMRNGRVHVWTYSRYAFEFLGARCIAYAHEWWDLPSVINHCALMAYDDIPKELFEELRDAKSA